MGSDSMNSQTMIYRLLFLVFLWWKRILHKIQTKRSVFTTLQGVENKWITHCLSWQCLKNFVSKIKIINQFKFRMNGINFDSNLCIKGSLLRSGRVTHFKRTFSKTYLSCFRDEGHSSLSCGTLICFLSVGNSFKTGIISVDLG